MSNHPYIWGVLVPMVVSAVVSIFAKEIRAILGAIAVSGGRSLNQRFIGLLACLIHEGWDFGWREYWSEEIARSEE